MRAALRWAQESGDTALGLRLAGALERFWERHGHLSEGRGWLEDLLAVESSNIPGATAAVRAKALTGAGTLAFRQGNYVRATALAEESLTLWRELGDRSSTATMLNNLGIVAAQQGDYARATALFEENLALKRELCDRSSIAAVLNNLGLLAWEQGDYARATALHEESLALRRELGDKQGMTHSLNNLEGRRISRVTMSGQRHASRRA